MYDASYYFYPNALNKLTVSMRDHPVLNADGSLDLYFSHEKPANVSEANWLPAPADRPIHPDDADVLAERNASLDH
jgi:hypothetical protein